MAFQITETIPAEETTLKVLPTTIIFKGNELDKGRGTIDVKSIGRIVDAEGNPVLDSDEQEQYKVITGNAKDFRANIEDDLMTDFGGITGAQVLGWLGAWIDSKYEAL